MFGADSLGHVVEAVEVSLVLLTHFEERTSTEQITTLKVKEFVGTACSKRPTPAKPIKLLIGGLRQSFYFYFLDGIILQNSSERKVKKTNIEVIQNIINPSPSEGDFHSTYYENFITHILSAAHFLVCGFFERRKRDCFRTI